MRLALFLPTFLILFLSATSLLYAQSGQAPSNTLKVEVAADSDADFDADFEDDFSDEEEAPLIHDPLEGWNRGVFWFNDKLYFYALKPVARVYRIVPSPARKGVRNFFSNLSTPVRMVNAALQLKFRDAGRELGRFVINSTLGVGGLIEFAGRYGKLPRKDEDFGQTLGVYRVGQGPYLVLPFFGPSSLRDAGGLVVDGFLDPANWLTRDWTLLEKAGLKTGQAVNYLSLDDDSYEKIKRDSLDPYLFTRAAYAQYRLAKVAK